MGLRFALVVTAIVLELLCHTTSELTDNEAKAYLIRYGYVDKEDVSLINEPGERPKPSPKLIVNEKKSKERAKDVLNKAIRMFQKISNINETGVLDEATKLRMQKKRCGVIDTSAFNMFPSMNKWFKNDITWQFMHHSHQLHVTVIRDAIKEAFGLWSEVTPLNFTEVTINGDIVISFVTREHGNCPPFDGPGQVLAHATDPNGNPSFAHFDDEEYWVYRDEEKLRMFPFTDLLNVATHEIGHTLGLGHSNNEDAIMYGQYNSPFDRYGRYIGGTLREDDIRRIQALYGSKEDGTTTRRPRTTDLTTWFWGPWFGDLPLRS